MKILLSILIMMFMGCASKPNMSTTYTGKVADKHLLGTRLGCAKKMTQYGFTKEGCGDLWGKQVMIIWNE